MCIINIDSETLNTIAELWEKSNTNKKFNICVEGDEVVLWDNNTTRTVVGLICDDDYFMPYVDFYNAPEGVLAQASVDSYIQLVKKEVDNYYNPRQHWPYSDEDYIKYMNGEF